MACILDYEDEQAYSQAASGNGLVQEPSMIKLNL
jgi:hypothetical protein